MTGSMQLRSVSRIALFLMVLSTPVAAQRNNVPPIVFHRVEGRLQFRGPINDVRVRLVQQGGRILVDEKFTRGEGEFAFGNVPEGDYLIETEANATFNASSTNVSVHPLDSRRSEVFRVYVQLELKPSAATSRPGVVMADVDVNVPKDAQKHYREAMKALDSKSPERAISELQSALRIYPDYYAARLELGRELRIQKRFQEAAEVFEPLSRLAPKRAEARVEYGVVLMALGRRVEAITELRKAVELEETDWVPHLYLGMALLENEAADAERHLRRAIELNEHKAASAHLSLARLAAARGQRDLSIEHLQAYLTLVPEAPDAEAVRRLIERLRAPK
jgi:tetratricopeptide (TPR) repeat protein